jgi:hypothetical protein
MRAMPLAVYRFISRPNYAYASFQSRITLCGEIFRTLAVSSTLNPPKKTVITTTMFY